MNKQSKKSSVIVTLVFLLVIIFAYNYWSFQSGRCTIATLLSLSPLAIVLIACNLIAVSFLQIVKFKKKRLAREQLCSCGAHLGTQWDYCPSCGKQRGT